jgi:endonuclease/exonuclease/phosphatase family metal-dependent hydrolase
MKLVSYNIQYGMGRDGVFDPDRIAASVVDADIIALQEVSRGLAQNGGADLVALMKDRLPGHFAAFAAAMDIDGGSGIVDGRTVTRRRQFGNMILSRWPILATRNLLLPRTRSFDRANFQRAALEALIVTPLGPLRIYDVHLDHIHHEERMLQITHLKERIFAYPMEGGAITGAAEYGEPELPHPEDFILLGDFNMTPDSPEYVLMAGGVDHAEGRRIVAHHPVDASVIDGPEGEVSWIDTHRPERRGRLDYCFVSTGIAHRVRRSWIDTQALGSDHFPVWVEMGW